MLQKELLIVNLGSPQYPLHEHVGAFLKEFLMDKYVLRMPYIIRYLLVNKIIVPKRVYYSTANYGKIWSKKYGSPIIYNTQELVKRLEEQLLSKGDEESKCVEGSREIEISGVSFAMRYGEYSISQKINELAAKGAKELLVVPMYPQCEGSTYVSTIEEVKRAAELEEVKVDFVPPFYKDSDYIAALAQSVKSNTINNKTPNVNIVNEVDIVTKIKNRELDKLLISFHGIPIKYLPCGAKCAHNCKDPLLPIHKSRQECSSCYKQECYTTAYLLAEALGLENSEFEVLFQSRLGGGEWITPYLAKRVAELPKSIDECKGEEECKVSLLRDKEKSSGSKDKLSGSKEKLFGSKIKKVAVIAPSFTADCLETLYEIDMEIKKLFLESGGEEFIYIPSLNYSDFWVERLCNLVRSNL